MRSALQWNAAATLPPLTRIAAHAFILVADGGSGGLDEGDVVAAQEDAAEGLDLRAREPTTMGSGGCGVEGHLFSAGVDFLSLVQRHVHELRTR